MTQNIVIISHGRSGTHLTIDLIRNNFKSYIKPYVPIKTLLDNHNGLESDLLSGYLHTIQIFKSHLDGNYFDYSDSSEKLASFYHQLLDSSKIIYVFRDPKDTLTSLYFHFCYMGYKITSNNVNEFVFNKNDYYSNSSNKKLNRIEYWNHHALTWINQREEKDILFISFEQIMNHYNETILRLASYLDQEPRMDAINIRMTRIDSSIIFSNKIICDKIHHTSVNFREGVIGNYKKYLNRQTIEKIDAVTKQTLDLLEDISVIKY